MNTTNRLMKLLWFFNNITLFHDGSFLVHRKMDFYFGRFIYHGIAYPRVFHDMMVFANGHMTFEVADKCNLKCKGCHYFEDTTYKKRAETTVADYDAYFSRHRAMAWRLVTAHIGGAEPSLELDKIRFLSKHTKHLVVYSNGIVKIPEDLRVKIHISLWGQDDKGDRGASVLEKSTDNYRNDPRAAFVLTINHSNIDEIYPTVKMLVSKGLSVTFNHYSPTHKHINTRDRITKVQEAAGTQEESLMLTAEDLNRAKHVIDRLLEEYPEHMVYTSQYNAWIHHDAPQGVREFDDDGKIICCVNYQRHPGMFYKAVTADLQDKPGKCCVPDVRCESCRLYTMAWIDFLVQCIKRLKSRKDIIQLSKNLRMYKKLNRV
ncbi:MAG: hypothetical protein GY801_07695 [bacterium]|nr:hypothetical protein [bacterium]